MKKRRFADGGDADALEMANQGEDLATELRGENTLKAMRDADAAPKGVTKEALAKSGLSLRDYMNKQQGLTRKPYSGTGGSAGGRGPTAEEFAAAATPSKRARLESALDRGIANPKGYADPEFSPQAGGIATGALKGLSAAAKNLMGRAAKPAAKAAERVDPEFASQAGGAAVKALAAPVKRAGLDKAGAKAAERSARAESRNAEMLKENLKRYGMTERTSPDAIRGVRDNLGMGQNWKVMKKGGAVKTYAAGGAVSSRADGIAQRGKTRCKVC